MNSMGSLVSLIAAATASSSLPTVRSHRWPRLRRGCPSGAGRASILHRDASSRCCRVERFATTASRSPSSSPIHSNRRRTRRPASASPIGPRSPPSRSTTVDTYGTGRENLTLQNLDWLTWFTGRIRQALAAQGVTGAGGQEIDHIELFGPSPRADSRNFVLCPGKAYDRSPCGTGTSAKLACLYAAGKLREGQAWRQASILGSVFEGTVRVAADGRVIPRITGTAYVTAEATLLLDPRDPFRMGIRK